MRQSDLTAYTQRLTPAEIARLWFRRGPDYAANIHVDYPDFPAAGPDGLYLRESVKVWFERWHGIRRGEGPTRDGETEALRIARGGRQNASSSH